MNRLALTPANEPERLVAIRRYDILDTPPDGSFDRITATAARRFGVPISIISIVDHDRIWFKSHHGLDVQQISRDPGLCASAIVADRPWILPDAKRDVRALNNPLVAGEFGLRFYAGVPLKTWDGFNLGTLCVIDREPRSIDQDQIEELQDLASIVMDQMELRLSARQAVAQARMLAREIEHRVMNSLQFVSGMLGMQSRTSRHAEVARTLSSAAERVTAVARVHRHLHADEASEKVACLRFLKGLCAELTQILGKTIHVGGVEALVATSQIQPIGLIVNELATNAAKAGAAQIWVRLSSDGKGIFALAVMDDGPGLPPDFNPAESSGGLGMQLVRALSGQLRGTVEIENSSNGRGACFKITFLPLDARVRPSC